MPASLAPSPGSGQARKGWADVNRESVMGAAYRAVRNALRDGRLTPPAECSGCGSVPRGKLDPHHDDYSKPLAVRWLCHPCHVKHHWKERVRCSMCSRAVTGGVPVCRLHLRAYRAARKLQGAAIPMPERLA